MKVLGLSHLRQLEGGIGVLVSEFDSALLDFTESGGNGDKLVSAGFPQTYTRGFVALDDPNVAVCVLPGTELVEREVRCETGILFAWRLGHRRDQGD
jgi:hypothetical protein